MNKKQLKTVIIVCWILLAICFVIKIFGGNWFELSSDNEKFVQFCTFVDNTMWLKMILVCCISVITSYPVYCVLLNKKKLSTKETIIYLSLTIFKSFISWYSAVVSLIIDVFIMLVLSTIINKKIFRSIVCFFIILIFQVITLIIRNSEFTFLQNTFIFQTLYQIDYYIMIALLYLYNFKSLIGKEES